MNYKNTSSYMTDLQKLKVAIDKSDAIVIGAGAGLSTSAGFTYSGKRFYKYFQDFSTKYGFNDMYSGGFYPYNSLEEYWAYWSRYVKINRYETAPNEVYNDLYQLIKDKNYFVLTTNVDHCFQKAGFNKKRLFYTQGDYGLFQCCKPCCQKTYDNQALIERMVTEQKNMHIPTRLIPKCPVCGRPMVMNLRSDDHFVQDDGWYQAANRYNLFINTHKNMHILFLELGVGYNTPVIIKYPFWKMTAENPLSIYSTINYGQAICPKEIEQQAICINDDIGKVLKQLKKLKM